MILNDETKKELIDLMFSDEVQDRISDLTHDQVEPPLDDEDLDDAKIEDLVKVENQIVIELAKELLRRYDDEERDRVQTIDDLVEMIQFEHDRAKDRLESEVKELDHRVDRVRESVEQGMGVNSLGELQSSGPRFDIACAEYMLTGQFIRKVGYYADRLR